MVLDFDISALVDVIDSSIDASLQWLYDHAGSAFDIVRLVLDSTFAGIHWVLVAGPFWVVILAFALLAWRCVGLGFCVIAAVGLWLCQLMGLWPETMSTLTLVIASTILAIGIALPLGVVVGLAPTATRATNVVLDFVQTMPPYVYLLPSIALIGYGSATAMSATTLVAIPPALRLTALGIRLTPTPFRELGAASGMTGAQQLFRIRIPCALPSILAGVNQSLMLGFAMVVIAGIVGSGGLGQTVYDAVRTLNIGKAVDAGIAIVILTIVLDRLSQSVSRLTIRS